VVLVVVNFSCQVGGQEEPLKKYVVELEPTARAELEGLTRRGRASARQIKRALILLAAADGDSDGAIAAKVRVHPNTVQRVRQRFAEESLEAALSERPRPGKVRMLDGRQEAYLIAVACSEAPAGRARWTVRLLANRLVELNVVEDINYATVWRVLKRGIPSPGSASSGASPPSAQRSSAPWRTCSICSRSLMTQSGR